MKVTYKNTPSIYDIPLCHMSMPDLQSNEIIQINDYSSYISGNSIAPVAYVNTQPTNSDNKLISSNIYNNLLVTDEYYYNRMTGSKEPLWYTHSIRGIYYNNKAITRIINRSIRDLFINMDRKVLDIRPNTGDYIIIRGSV